MTKLIIQIPCFNEAETIAVTLQALPRAVPGVDVVEILIIDDGSTDDTVAVARANGADHVVSHARNLGLARAFMTGLDASLREGADVIVNTDADNQYCADDIPALVAPVLAGSADMVVGARPIETIEHFSPVKKRLQRLGSWAVRVASGTDIPDAPSGFRAISRRAAMQLNVFSSYTYTIETIIQAGRSGMAITSVPVRVNDDLRPSRLVTSVPSYVQRSLLTIFRVFMTYKPMRTFMVPGLIFIALGVLVGVRYLYFFAVGEGAGHVQSVILTVALLLIGFQLAVFGLIGDLFAANRMMLSEVQLRLRQLAYDGVAEEPDDLRRHGATRHRRPLIAGRAGQGSDYEDSAPSCTSTRTMVHGIGERTSRTVPVEARSCTISRFDQWCRCPGVFPIVMTCEPRATLRVRHIGSLGTEIRTHLRATRTISASARSGSDTCSRTSIALTMSNSPSA